MKRAALLLALFARPALAVDPPAPPPGHVHVPMAKGDPAPSDGIFADADLSRYDAQRLLWLQSEVAECQVEVAQGGAVTYDGSTTWLVVGLVVGALVAGGGVFAVDHVRVR